MATRTRLAALMMSVALLIGPSTASAQKATQDELAEEERLLHLGDEAMKRHDFAAALDAYRAVNARMHLPATALEVARAEAALGKLIEARDTCLQIAEMEPYRHERAASREAREAALHLEADLSDEIPTVVVRPANLLPADAFSLIIDGRPVPAAESRAPRAIDPGEHELRVITRRYYTVVTRFEARAGEALVVPINFDLSRPKPRDLTPPKHRPRFASGSLQEGAKVVGVIGGVVGLSALAYHVGVRINETEQARIAPSR